MRREITINSVSFSTLIPGMEASRCELHRGPDDGHQGTRGEDAVHRGLYLDGLSSLGVEKGDAPIKGWEDMKGKAVTVDKGTPQTLSKKMGQEIGFEVQAYDTQPDAIQGGPFGPRLDPRLPQQYHQSLPAPSKNQMFVADLWFQGHARPLGHSGAIKAIRNLRVTSRYIGLHEEGRLARKLPEAFRRVPPPDALERTITPGYSVPGI